MIHSVAMLNAQVEAMMQAIGSASELEALPQKLIIERSLVLDVTIKDGDVETLT